jgi:hypothetical protein
MKARTFIRRSDKKYLYFRGKKFSLPRNFRILKVGEIKQHGDCFIDHMTGNWIETQEWGATVVGEYDFVIRF